MCFRSITDEDIKLAYIFDMYFSCRIGYFDIIFYVSKAVYGYLFAKTFLSDIVLRSNYLAKTLSFKLFFA